MQTDPHRSQRAEQKQQRERPEKYGNGPFHRANHRGGDNVKANRVSVLTRLERLEEPLRDSHPCMVWTDNPPTAEQLETMERARAQGRTVIPVGWLDATV